MPGGWGMGGGVFRPPTPFSKMTLIKIKSIGKMLCSGIMKYQGATLPLSRSWGWLSHVLKKIKWFAIFWPLQKSSKIMLFS